MAKKQHKAAESSTPVERMMMLRRDREGISVYWSLIGWSEIYAMQLPEAVAVAHADRLSEDFGKIDVIPYGPIPRKASKPAGDYQYVR